MALDDQPEQDAERLERLLERGISQLTLHSLPQDRISQDQIQLLARLVLLLADWAPRINLTGHRDLHSMAVRLVLDAAALSHALPELEDARSVADLGSGAGFPGLPLAILNPHLAVRLVESRRKRHHFQRAARRELDLVGVDPILGRADQVDPLPADVVIAQAVAQPAQALTLMRPWARPGGVVVLPASSGAERPTVEEGLGGPLEERFYRVPESSIERKLWVGIRDDT